MRPFQYMRPADVPSAVRAASRQNAIYLAGGTNLVDLMKLGVTDATTLIDVTHLPLGTVEVTSDGAFRIGAMVRNSDLAYHPELRKQLPMLSEAILAGASPQLRNMATVGGNLLQRTRCVYFSDPVFPCNKRKPGSGCPAIAGYNRNLAVLGTSDHCIASNPSDMNVALAALDPLIRVRGSSGERIIPFADFHLLPGTTPNLETTLRPGELITHIEVPPFSPGKRSSYLKVRDRASYEFALVSVASALKTENGKITDARLALGGVGTRPWRAREAESILLGRAPERATYRAAAEAALKDAHAYEQNAFKIELAKRTIVRALERTEAIST